MKIRSIRRIVNDSNHNMCTASQWLGGALLVAYRQGDAHVSPNGKVLVLRSRDNGVTFEHVALLRGATDTRDPHLYTAEGKVHCVAFETDPIRITGASVTSDGLHWSPYRRFTGADGWWLWHPEYRDGRHYCCGYTWKPDQTDAKWSAIGWFESDNGFDWKHIATLREGDDAPSECCLLFRPNGEAVMLVRREYPSPSPLMMTARPPYREWAATPLDLPVVGMGAWLVGDEIWFSGRWFLRPDVAHMGVFRIEGDKPVLRTILPAGPEFDFSYMGVARHPLNSRRFMMTYYSNHTAPDNPAVNQWAHPAIYLVDMLFDRPFVSSFKVSQITAPEGGLAGAACPTPGDMSLRWSDAEAYSEQDRGETGFLDVSKVITGRAGVVYLTTELDVGPTGAGALHLGYDGPVRVWLNGTQVFSGVGTNPAVVDQTSVPVTFQHGRNHVAIALDTNGGKACGVFLRWEAR